MFNLKLGLGDMGRFIERPGSANKAKRLIKRELRLIFGTSRKDANAALSLFVPERMQRARKNRAARSPRPSGTAIGELSNTQLG